VHEVHCHNFVVTFVQLYAKLSTCTLACLYEVFGFNYIELVAIVVWARIYE